MVTKRSTNEDTKVFSLGEIATYINGRAFKPDEWGTEGLPIIRIQNLTKSSSTVNYYSGSFDEKHHIKNGDLLLAWSATLGIFEWNGGEALLNQHIFKVLPNEKIILKRYFYYLINYLLENLATHTHGSGMVHITKPKLLGINVMVPSFDVQQEIVAKLDEQMVEIEKLKKESEEELINADSLYKSYLAKVFEGNGNWNFIKMGDMFYTKYGISKSSVKDSSKTPALRMNNITYEGKLITDDITYLDLTEEEFNKHKLKKHDLLFNRTNSAELVGKTTVFDKDGDYVAVSYLVVATSKVNEINTKFVSYYLNTPYMKRYFIENCNRSISQANFNATKLSSIKVPVPNLATQNMIVKKIEDVNNEIDILKNSLNEQINAINQLQASTLNEVFGKYEVPEEV